MAADPMGSPGWPELAFCTMSTAKKRSVLTHCSSSMQAEGLLLPMLQKLPWRILPFTIPKRVEHRTVIRDSTSSHDSIYSTSSDQHPRCTPDACIGTVSLDFSLRLHMQCCNVFYRSQPDNCSLGSRTFFAVVINTPFARACLRSFEGSAD